MRANCMTIIGECHKRIFEKLFEANGAFSTPTRESCWSRVEILIVTMNSAKESLKQ
jgi:hypothetical protein